MIGLFRQLMGLTRLDPVWIDNNIFRLHYKLTVLFFVMTSILLTARQYFGDPIDCIVEGMNSGLMDTYCWIHTTFSIPSRFDGKVGEGVIPYHGITAPSELKSGGEVKYHKYYQWVCFVLFLEAVMFFIPRAIWKTCEGKKIKLLVQDLMEPLLHPEKKEVQLDHIVRYMILHRGTHVTYALKYFMCEFLNLVNVVVQMYFIDFFLGFEFWSYGLDVINFSEEEPEDRSDPMHVVFPKLTKCTFHKYGPSGTIERKDALCVLPLNIINEKIFIFLWFWLMILGCVTFVFLLYRIAVIIGPQIRVSLISVKCGRSVKREHVEQLINSPRLNKLEQIGDWLVIYFLCKNFDVLTSNELIKKFYATEKAHRFPSETETLKSRAKHRLGGDGIGEDGDAMIALTKKTSSDV